jgi:CRP-like cAMP-binding protein
MKYANLPASARKYKKYSALFKQGEPCAGAFVLLSGSVALSTGLQVGRKLLIAYRNEGAVLGLAETLIESTYQTTAVAATDVVVQFIPHCDVVAMARDTSSESMRIMSAVAEELTDLQKKQMLLALCRTKADKMLIC